MTPEEWSKRLRDYLIREMESTIGHMTQEQAARAGCQVLNDVFDDWIGMLPPVRPNDA